MRGPYGLSKTTMRTRLHDLGLGRVIGRLIRAPFVPGLSSTARTQSRRQAERLDVYTFVNDEDQYGAMLSSFAAVGFDRGATFTRLSDETSEPFSAINGISQEAGAPYAVLCHQDITLEHCHAAGLFSALAELDAFDPSWTVAGCAGVGKDLVISRAVFDVWGGPTDDRKPTPVMALDEIFLVLNRRNSPRCSQGIEGFHFYGTDVCLNALEDGGSAYVIDFPVTHHGLGNLNPEYRPGYEAVRRQFLAVWERRFALAYVGTTIEVLVLSRYHWLRRAFSSYRVLRWVSADRDMG